MKYVLLRNKSSLHMFYKPEFVFKLANFVMINGKKNTYKVFITFHILRF